MAEEIAEPVVVEAPVDHTASSFEGWSPNTPPKEESAPVVAETTPAAEGGEGTGQPTADAPKTGEWYKEFGEFTDSDAFKGHYQTLKTEREQLEARIKEAEGKTVGYSSEAIAQMDAYARKLSDEGMTDAREIQRKVLAKMQEASTDYLETAKTNPATIIERSVRERLAALNASDADIARAVRRETQLPPKPNLEDYVDASDPDYIEKMEAYQDAESDLRLKAMGIAQEFEAKREKFDFQPKGVMTEEQRIKAVNEATEKYNSRIPLLEAEIPKIEIAGHKLDFPLEGAYKDAINDAIQKPYDFMQQFLNDAGEPDVVTIGTMAAKIASIPLLIERAVKQAVHKHTEQVDGRLHNPSLTTTPNNGGGTTNIDPEESFRQWEKERASQR